MTFSIFPVRMVVSRMLASQAANRRQAAARARSLLFGFTFALKRNGED